MLQFFASVTVLAPEALETELTMLPYQWDLFLNSFNGFSRLFNDLRCL